MFESCTSSNDSSNFWFSRFLVLLHFDLSLLSLKSFKAIANCWVCNVFACGPIEIRLRLFIGEIQCNSCFLKTLSECHCKVHQNTRATMFNVKRCFDDLEDVLFTLG